MKNSLPYIKCVLRLSCVVHGLIYGRFIYMGCTVYYCTRLEPEPVQQVRSSNTH